MKLDPTSSHKIQGIIVGSFKILIECHCLRYHVIAAENRNTEILWIQLLLIPLLALLLSVNPLLRSR
jgi:hypothetical protein